MLFDNVSRLNAEVTAAILKAEEASRDAAKRWKEVAALEEALYKALPEGSPESAIAKRGIESASIQANLDEEIQKVRDWLYNEVRCDNPREYGQAVQKVASFRLFKSVNDLGPHEYEGGESESL